MILRNLVLAACLLAPLARPRPASAPPDDPPWRRVLAASCLDCHDPDASKGKLDLKSILDEDVSRHIPIWEKVVRRMSTRQMPPPGKKRPSESHYAAALSGLETELDAAAAARPDPGRPDTIRRLTRVEYQNAIRDLLALDIDASALLPEDESAHGFDAATAGTLSPTLLDRYLTAAQKISRLAVGSAGRSPGGETFRVRADITQEERVDGLPLGTRGGALIHTTVPADGDYELRIRLMRDRNEEVEGLHEDHEVEVLLDRSRVKLFTVSPPRKSPDGHSKVDAHLIVRVPMTSGPHDLGVTFIKKPSDVMETLRQPYNVHFNTHRHPRLSPALYEVSITGPYDRRGPGDSPSRRILFAAGPADARDEEPTARKILSRLIRRAFRRPAGEADLDRVLAFYRDARTRGDYEAGLEAALSALLVSHDFLFRIERDPAGVAPGTAYPLGNLDLATRLSFFLWSSIPDEELIGLAEAGHLSKPGELARQAHRMLADPRCTLVTNFAAQWLQLKNLESASPDGRLFPDFDDNLRQAMRRESQLLFEEILRENRSALDLLRCDHTYLNERLARHYGIPHVYGSHFRRVSLSPDDRRGGLLTQGSILTITSYATRTSPVLRGKWVLENLIGTPPPPPLPDVPALDETVIAASLPVRERLQKHRANAACAVCHDRIDPVGFSLENFDALGRWRTFEEGKPLDVSGGLGNGMVFEGVAGLQEALLKSPETFLTVLTEKLLTYALGRGLGPQDGAAVRKIVRAARADHDRIPAIVCGVVDSVPFRMRRSP